MTPTVSANTQAILLLTAPLLSRGTRSSAELLTASEYKRLARHLRQIEHEPSDLLKSDSIILVKDCSQIVDEYRLNSLLERGFLLSQVVEHWNARAIWVISRADTSYPRRLKALLREDAPVVLYGCGPAEFLDSGGLAVVGSRDVNQEMVRYSMEIGRLAANAKCMIVSGGAKGVDRAAMNGALEVGGRVCGVLADGLERTAVNREHRNFLLDNQMVLTSPFDPGAGFNVGNAMQRNKLIYALAHASLVVNSDLKKGGTWAGAIEQLDKFRFAPVYVRSTGAISQGLEALKKKGALEWPNPGDVSQFLEIFELNEPVPSKTSSIELELSFDVDENTAANHIAKRDRQTTRQENVKQVAVNAKNDKPVIAEGVSATTPAEQLFENVYNVLQNLLKTPKSEVEVAAALDVSLGQARTWLNRLSKQGRVIKKKKPSGYVVNEDRLFE